MFQVIQEILEEIRKLKWSEIFIRFFLLFIFIQIERFPPFERIIHKEELWYLSNPRTDNYVSPQMLFFVIIPLPMVMFLLIFLFKRNKADFVASNMAYSLGVGLNGFITDIIKVTCGRPRPDFFWRCFPDGKVNYDGDRIQCTNPNLYDIKQGLKSFPSGHASFAFLSFGFIAFYFIGKLKIFTTNRGHTVKVVFCLLPLVVATLVAISRTCDYHHFPSDVTVGSLIGLLVSYFCYRQYFPALDSGTCDTPYSLSGVQKNESTLSINSIRKSSDSEKTSLLDGDDKYTKE